MWLLSRNRGIVQGALVVIIAMSISVPGFAQDTPSETERAREEFRSGVGLLKQEDWAGAETHLRAALSLRTSAVIRYNLALALAHQDRVAEAVGLLQHVTADESARDSIRDRARELLQETEPRVGYIEVRLEGDAEGVTLNMDESPLELSSLGAPLPADPGDHVLTAIRAQQEVAQAHVSLAAGAQVSLSLRIPAAGSSEAEVATALALSPAQVAETQAPPAAASAPVDYDSDQVDEGGGSILKSGWFWLGAGAVVVGVVVAGAAVASSNSDSQQMAEGTLGTIEIGSM